MNLEHDIAALNEKCFFREFVFSDNKCCLPDGREIEIGDNIVALDNTSMVFEIKEREFRIDTTQEAEERWYRNKILKKATKQVCATVQHLRSTNEIVLSNRLGRRIRVHAAQTALVHQFIIYLSHPILPRELRFNKVYYSRNCGVIHTLHADDYANLVEYLMTPAEVAEYFTYRAQMFDRWQEQLNGVSEAALLGQYIANAEHNEPSEEYIEHIRLLQRDKNNWDMSRVLNLLHSRVEPDDEGTDYYHILAEIAQLMRHELREFRARFDRSIDAATNNRFELPYRFYLPRTGCAYVFVPLEKEYLHIRRQAVQNMTIANMYACRSDKGIGLSFVAREDGGWNIEVGVSRSV